MEPVDFLNEYDKWKKQRPLKLQDVSPETFVDELRTETFRQKIMDALAYMNQLKQDDITDDIRAIYDILSKN